MSATREKIRPLAVAQARAGLRPSQRTPAPGGVLLRFPVERVSAPPPASLPPLLPESSWSHAPRALFALCCGAALALLLHFL